MEVIIHFLCAHLKKRDDDDYFGSNNNWIFMHCGKTVPNAIKCIPKKLAKFWVRNDESNIMK